MTNERVEPFDVAAYGGTGWSPRTNTLRQELGSIWSACGASSEWSRLEAVLLHRPGRELAAGSDRNLVQMLETIDLEKAQGQFKDLVEAYQQTGVEVVFLEPEGTPLPNQMFIADLMFMTPEGAIVARPASTVRAGEERQVARRLAQCGIPIIHSVRGEGTFEGADALWVDPKTVILGCGLRTNPAGAAQVTAVLNEMAVEVIQVDLPFGTMHLMGMLRIVDKDLALAWPRRLAYRGVALLRERGFTVAFIPDEAEAAHQSAFNLVPLGPREVLMAAEAPLSQSFYENLGITCHTVDVSELRKAAGAMGCLTGILRRESGGRT